MSLGQALESSSCRAKIGLDFGLDRHWVQVGLARFDSGSGGSRTRLGLDKGEFRVSVCWFGSDHVGLRSGLYLLSFYPTLL